MDNQFSVLFFAKTFFSSIGLVLGLIVDTSEYEDDATDCVVKKKTKKFSVSSAEQNVFVCRWKLITHRAKNNKNKKKDSGLSLMLHIVGINNRSEQVRELLFT